MTTTKRYQVTVHDRAVYCSKTQESAERHAKILRQTVEKASVRVAPVGYCPVHRVEHKASGA